MRLTINQTEALAYAVNHINMYSAMRLIEPCPVLPTRSRNGFIISGVAGAGKSVVIRALIHHLNQQGLYGKVISFTGRAASHLCDVGIAAQTAHSLLLSPVLDHLGNLLYFEKRPPQETVQDIGDFLIIEECGMMPEELLDDILKFNIPIIPVGDDEQLGAIKGDNIFDLAKKDPIIKEWGSYFLTEILRTGDDSPIDELSSNVRLNNRLELPKGINPGDSVRFGKLKDAFTGFIRNNYEYYDSIICGTNRFRKKINSQVRHAMGVGTELPEPGETIMCLRNNVINNNPIMNGELYVIDCVFESFYKNCHQYTIYKKSNYDAGKKKHFITVNVDDEMFISEQRSEENRSRRELSDFTYGYGISCHRNQGSTNRSVLFLDEDVSYFLNTKKYRYTGITRASEHVTILK